MLRPALPAPGAACPARPPLQRQMMRAPVSSVRAGAAALVRGRRAPGAAATPTAPPRRPLVAARVASVGSGGKEDDTADGLPQGDAAAIDALSAVPALPILPQAGASASGKPPPATSPEKNPAAAAAAAAAAPHSPTPRRFYGWYLERLERQPALTKAVTALCGFVIGDLVAQSLSGGGGSAAASAAAAAALGAATAASSSPLSSPFAALAAWLSHVDWARTARMGAFGFLFDGPVGGAYYSWLDRTIMPEAPTSTRAVVAKTLLDQTVYSSLGTVCFFAFIRILETGDASTVWPTLCSRFWPTLAANWTIWPLAHLVNFRFVPPPLRVAYNQVVAIGWLTWLSLLAHGRAASAPAVAALAHKAAAAASGGAAVGGGGGGGFGAWLHSVLGALPHV